MLMLTPQAAAQVLRSATELKEPAILRVAARRMPGGAIDYGMGFDEWRSGDVRILSEGVVVVVAQGSRELLDRTTIDYVEIAPGDFRFIFAAGNAGEASRE